MLPIQAGNAFPKTVVVLIDRITFNDLIGAESPSLKRLLDVGAIGLMNPATGGPKTPERALLTLGWGRHTTRSSPDTLDAELRKASVRVAHISPGRPGNREVRSAGGIAKATVRISETTLLSGHAQSQQTITQPLLHILPICDLCLAILDDPSRIEVSTLSRAERSRLRRQAISRLEPLWKMLLQLASRGIDIWMLTPCPPADSSGRWENLTPIVRIGKGVGLLTSGTTQTPGVVANIDFAPSLMRDFGLQPPLSMTGRAMAVHPHTDRLNLISHLDRMATLNGRAVAPVMIGYGAFFVLLLAACVVALSRSKISPTWRLSLQVGILLAGATPLGLLTVSLFDSSNVWQLGLRSVLLTGILAVMSFLISRRSALSGLALLFAGTCLIVVGDTMFHGPLVRDSVLSSYLLTGIRYYGVGNEYMGVLLGMGLTAPALLMDDLRLPKARLSTKIMIGVWLILIMATLGLPIWGAKFGGVITATPVCILAGATLMGYRLSRRTLLLALAGLFALVGVFIAWDLLRGISSQTHVGRLIRQIQAEGWKPFLEIVIGKLRMNLGFILSPQGWIPAVASLICLGWLVSRLKPKIRRAFQARPMLQALLPVAAAGAILALIANDSGIVPFGFITGTWVYSLLATMLQEEVS